MFSIEDSAYYSLLKKTKKVKTEMFVMSVADIDRKIAYNTQCKLSALNITFIDASDQNLKVIKTKLSSEY